MSPGENAARSRRVKSRRVASPARMGRPR
jgi:hypothetical protein